VEILRLSLKANELWIVNSGSGSVDSVGRSFGLAGKTPQQLIAEGRIRDLVVKFERLREGQPV
jgi:hypothetical protein